MSERLIRIDPNEIGRLVDALVTDGEHHKQWYLEQILLDLIGEIGYANLKGQHEWEDGIAP